MPSASIEADRSMGNEQVVGKVLSGQIPSSRHRESVMLTWPHPIQQFLILLNGMGRPNQSSRRQCNLGRRGEVSKPTKRVIMIHLIATVMISCTILFKGEMDFPGLKHD